MCYQGTRCDSGTVAQRYGGTKATDIRQALSERMGSRGPRRIADSVHTPKSEYLPERASSNGKLRTSRQGLRVRTALPSVTPPYRFPPFRRFPHNGKKGEPCIQPSPIMSLARIHR